MSVIHLKKKDVVKSKVRGVEIEFDHEKLATILGIPGNNGILETTEEKMMMLMNQKDEREKEDERNKDDFDWEAVFDEATVEGESGSDDQFYDAQVEVEEPMTETQATRRVPAPSSAQQKDKEPSGVDPSCPTGRILEAELLKFQAEFERKRANRFHDDLEKAKAENARLLALLHQDQSKPHP
ncbi:hypothetical protein Dimus_020825 [Dionaea muscipula]